MFTGLIQAIGRIAAREARGGDVRLRIAAGEKGQTEVDQLGCWRLFGAISRKPENPEDEIHSAPFFLQLGESIAVSGVCLTLVAFDAQCFEVDVSNETMARTTLGALEIGAAVNLERALLATDRLGGHLVSGHVDGVGSVLAVIEDARSQRWTFSAPAAVLRYVAEKGSICVDGVSLTVNAVDAAGFEVNLIPHTLEHTAFCETAIGAAVNLEVDLVARYVERLLTKRE